MCVQDATGQCLSISARALKTASLWFSFEVMPGMVVLISACRVSGGQLLGFSFSHKCASVVRMSACSFCCSFTRWFRLFLFNFCLFVFLFCFFFVGSFELLVQGVVWHPLHLSAWIRSLACLLSSSGSTPAVYSISAKGVVFMAPRIVLKPIFWTLSSLLVCVLAAIAQALAPYSRDSRTVPM